MAFFDTTLKAQAPSIDPRAIQQASGGFLSGAMDEYNRIDELKKQEAAKAIERQRLADVLKLQQNADRRAEEEYKIKQKENLAKQAYSAELAKGRGVVDGILTNTIPTDYIDKIAYTQEELKSKTLPQWKTDAQAKLSDIANSDTVIEDRLGQLQRVRQRLAEQGHIIPGALTQAIDTQTLANITQQKEAKKTATSTLADITDKINEAKLKYGVALDKELSSIDKGKKTGTTTAKFESGFSDIYKALAKASGETNVNKVPSDVKDSVIAAYTDMVKNKGFSPEIASTVITNSISSKSPAWWNVLGKEKVAYSISPEELKNAERMKESAKSVGTSDIDNTTTTAQRMVLEDIAKSLKGQEATAKKDLRLASMSPEERRKENILSMLSQVAVPNTKKEGTKKNTDTSTNNAATSKNAAKPITLSQVGKQSIFEDYDNGIDMTEKDTIAADKANQAIDNKKINYGPYKIDPVTGKIEGVHFQSLGDVTTVNKDISGSLGSFLRENIDKFDDYVKSKTYNKDGSHNAAGTAEVLAEVGSYLIGPSAIRASGSVLANVGRKLIQPIRNIKDARATKRMIEEAIEQTKNRKDINALQEAHREIVRQIKSGKYL